MAQSCFETNSHPEHENNSRNSNYELFNQRQLPATERPQEMEISLPVTSLNMFDQLEEKCNQEIEK